MRERKFIHSCGSVGRVEDVVVSSAYRGKQLGKLAVNLATALAARLGCYKVTSHTILKYRILGIINSLSFKVTLNCADSMTKFYASLGYRSEEGNSNYMCIRLDS